VTYPPLLPVLTAVWNALWPSGIYAATWINLAAAALTIPLLFALGRRLAGSHVPGLFAAAALLGNPWYLDELMGGRSIPIAFLLFVTAMLLVHRVLTGGSIAAAAAAGVLTGLAFEARFDYLLPSIALAVAIGAAFARTRSDDRRRLATAYRAGVACALAPWIAYSMAHFGVPFVSDQTRSAITVESVYFRRFVPFPETMATLRTAPAAWLASKAYGSLATLKALAIAFAVSPVPALVLARIRAYPRYPRPRESAIVLALGCVALALQAAPIAVTGNSDPRLFTALVAWIAFTAASVALDGRGLPNAAAGAAVLLVPAQAALLAATGPPFRHESVVLAAVWLLTVAAFLAIAGAPSGALARVGRAAAIAVPAAAIAIGSAMTARSTGTHYSLSAGATARTPGSIARIVEGLQGVDRSQARIMLSSDAGGPPPWDFGARTGIVSLWKPARPFGRAELEIFVRRYAVTHVIAGDPELDAWVPTLFVTTKSPNGALWTIRR
jgi:hypothetical protein